MIGSKCPGQDDRRIEVALIKCPSCGYKVEIFSDEICEIIAHHHSPGVIRTLNFKVLYDADWLVNLKDETKLKDKVKLKHIIEKVFLTKTGRQLAEAKYL